MKPHSVDTEPFRSVDDFFSIRLEPLTVVFGRNNAGKSNALAALTNPLVRRSASASNAEWSRFYDPTRPIGRFWVEAPEDGTEWDRALRREVYVRLINFHTPGTRHSYAAEQRRREKQTAFEYLSIEELGGLLINLMLGSFDVNESPEGRSEAESAFRELLRSCLVGFTEGDVQLGFPLNTQNPEVLALVRIVCQWYPLGVPKDSGIMGFELEDESAVLIDHSESSVCPTLLSADWSFAGLEAEIDAFISRTRRVDDTPVTWPEFARSRRPWLLHFVPPSTEQAAASQVNPSIDVFAKEITQIANRLLPRFLRGTLDVHPTMAFRWDQGSPRIAVTFFEDGRDQCAGDLSEEGSGVGRWSAVALRLAMAVLERAHAASAQVSVDELSLDGFVVLLDEPEAHLHPAAVRDVVEWCYMVADMSACVFVATHHEAFLSRLRPGTSLVHVTKPDVPTESRLRQVESSMISELQDLAEDVGLSAGSALGLFKAVLFVEGPLDVAVLEEYAGRRLESAGVLLVPIHGTKNLEGLVTSEVIQRLDCRQGVLLDATDVPTLHQRRGKHLSSEEKKVLRVLDIASEQGRQRPKVFGVKVRDLLYSLSEEGIRKSGESEYVGADRFPGWTVIDGEARAHFGADGSQSVNWKAYVHEVYGVPLESAEGVRSVVRWLDVHGYPNSTVSDLVDDIVNWAGESAESAD